MKELNSEGQFIVGGIILIIVLFIIFLSDDKDEDDNDFTGGLYINKNTNYAN